MEEAAQSIDVPAQPVSIIKRKRSGARKALRTRRTETDEPAKVEEDEEDEETDAQQRLNLEETRLLQKMRKRKKGLAALDSVPTAGATAEENSAVENGPKAPVLGISNFKQEVKENPVDKQMQAYVDEQLAIRTGKSLDDKPQQEQPRTQEDELFQTPAHLKVQRLEDMEKESGDRWLTGIAEVPLSIDIRLKNIEDTEAAKRKLMLERARGQQQQDAGPYNFNSNYKQHQRQWAQDKRKEFQGVPVQDEYARKEKRTHGGAGSHSQADRPHGDKPQFASDDKAVHRFMKQEKRRWK